MRKRYKILLLILLFLSIIIAIDLYCSNFCLQTDTYEIISPKLTSSFRIVQLSDIHDSEFGKSNCNLISKVADAAPDLILITGDLINDKKSIDEDYVKTVISGLAEIAPAYISFGNQEDSVQKEGTVDLDALYTDAGGIVLEKEYTEIEVNGQTVRIGGIYGYCQPTAFAEETNRQLETEFLMEFQDTDECKILMCHMPCCFLESGSLYEWDVDAVFAGHAHGGQIRIPFIGGLWAPDQGWFPGQECGVYSTTEENWIEHRKVLCNWAKENGYDSSYYTEERTYEPSYLILSRGLGNTDWVPRFNNIPEIVVVDFVPEK